MQILDNQEVRNLGNLELLAQQAVEGFIVGLHKSPFHGFSVEFAEHRLYNQGESTRLIDWKVYARTGRLYSKKYEEETNLRCQIVIDTSSTMYFPYDEKDPAKYQFSNKLAFAAQAAASLMNLLKKQRDAFGLTLFDDEVRSHTGCKSSTVHYRLLLSQLAQQLENQRLGKNTAAAKALHQVAESVHRRSLVVIFSDMFDNSEDSETLFSALQHLKHNKHEVILFHVTDRAHELEFEYENRPYIFVDMETSEEVKLQPNQVKEFYREQVGKYRDELRMRCLQYKIDFVEADIKDGFRPVLQQYLVKRSRMGV